MQKKAQLSIFSIIFIIIVFVIILAVALSPFITTVSSIAVSAGGLTGLEAFLIANLLLWVIIIFMIWVLWVSQ